MEGLLVINEPSVPAEVLVGYRKANLRLSLPAPERRSQRLAIVGSGPGLEERIEELRSFDGEIWAINGAWAWLTARNIPATFFSIDPLPVIGDFAKGAKRVIFASQCDPVVFGQCIARGAEVFCIQREQLGGFSAVGALLLARDLRYEAVEVFGCECSYLPERTHVDGRILEHELFVIGVGDEDFLTRMAYYQQALLLAKLIGSTSHFSEHSGGLLGALVDCYDPLGLPPDAPWEPQQPTVTVSVG